MPKVIDTKADDFTFDQQPIDFNQSFKPRTRYVADFEATTYFETDDPKLNQISADNTIDGIAHTYPKSEHQRVDVWLWCIQAIDYDDQDNVLKSDQHIGYSIDSFIDYIKSHCMWADIYFHNGANYDSKFIWDYCLNHGWVSIKQGTSYGGYLNTITGSYNRYTVRFDNGNAINFRDTRDMFNTSVRDMGNTLSHEYGTNELKGETPIIVSDDYYKDDFKVKQEWIDYCKRDVQILHDYITFKDTIDVSSLNIKDTNNQPVSQININFDVPSKLESGYSTAASYANATLMNSGNEPEVHLNPRFVPVANIKIDTMVRPKKGKIIDHWDYKEKTGQVNHQEYLANLTDQQISTLQSKYNAEIVKTDDSNSDYSAVIQWSTLDKYYIYQASYRDATDDELSKWSQYRKHLKKLSDVPDIPSINNGKQDSELFAKICHQEMIYNDLINRRKMAKDKYIAISTKASHGSFDRIIELKDKMDNTKSDTYKQQIKAKMKHEALNKLTEVANDLAKSTYKGGVSMVGPYYMNKFYQLDGLELDINSLYPSIYGNLRWNNATDEERQSGKAGRNFVFPTNYVNGTPIMNPSKKQLDYYMNNIDKTPSFVKISHLSAKIKSGKMPIIKPRTDDIYNTDSIYVNGDNADPREHYYPEITLSNIKLTMPEYKYLRENYTIDKHNGHEICTVTELWSFDRNTELEQKMYQHAMKWSALKQYAKDQNLTALIYYAKLMLNSPYGKMGNYKKQYATQMITKNGTLTLGHTQGGNMTAQVPTASYITAYGRIFLAETVNKIGLDKFIYCDTDSIYIVADNIPQSLIDAHLIDKTELGKWALEKKFTAFKAIKSKCYGVQEVKFTNTDGSPAGHNGWFTTAAGFTANIDQDNFYTSHSSIIQRSKIVNGGKLIYKTYQQINPINEAYIELLNNFYNLSISN